MSNSEEFVANNSIIDIEDLKGVLCITDNLDCCSSNYSHHAYWRSPQGRSSTNAFIISSGQSVLQIARTVHSLHSGIWHCEIPDKFNIAQNLYVGLYRQGMHVLMLPAYVLLLSVNR